MERKRVNISKIASVFLVLFCIGFTVALILEKFIGAKVNFFLLAGFFVFCLALGYLFFCLFSSKIQRKHFSIAFYRANYQKIIGDAFLSKRKQEKMLRKALDAMQNHEYEKGIRILETLQPLCVHADERFTAIFFQALFYDRLSLPLAAIPLYEEALDVKEHSSAASNLASCLERTGDLFGAIEMYLYSIELDAENPYPYNNLSHLYFQTEEYARSLEYADLALQRKHNFKEAHAAKAYCYAMLGEQENFERALRKAVMFGADQEEIFAFLQKIGAKVSE
jgi:tetratricopeptide (TPR) repeat protein